MAQTAVAGAAALAPLRNFTEKGEDGETAAAFVVVGKGAQRRRGFLDRSFRRFRELAGVKLLVVFCKVIVRTVHVAHSRPAIAPRAPNLLVVFLERLGRTVVHHPANIRLCSLPVPDIRPDNLYSKKYSSHM